MNDLNDVLSELDQICDLYQFGLQLGVRPNTLDRIEQNSFKVESRLKDVVKAWLSGDYMADRYGPRNWESLSKAVQKLNPASANRIKKRHCKH